MGKGDGNFSQAIMYRTGSISSISVALCDLDKDNLLDLIVISNDTNSISISFGNYESFQSATVYRTDEQRQRRVSRNSNRGLSNDIISARFHGEKTRKVRDYVESACLDPGMYTAEQGPSVVAFGDINNDTYVDILVTSLLYFDIRAFLGRGDGSFGNRIAHKIGGDHESVMLVDVNNDDRLDVIVLNAYSNFVGTVLGYGNGSFANVMLHSTVRYPKSIVTGDFNSDAQLDLVVGTLKYKTIDILLGYGNGSFASPVTYQTDIYASNMGIGDFNNDTRLDIVVAYGSDIGVLLGHGDGSFATVIKWSTSFFLYQIIVGDVNNDDRLDIVFSTSRPEYIGVLLGYGNGSFPSPITYVLDRYLSSITLGDLDRDGQMDLIATASDQSDVRIFHGYGNGSFANYTTRPTRQLLQKVAVQDLNDDDQLDIIAMGYKEAAMVVFISTGERFSMNKLTIASSVGSSLRSVIVNDFNSDGRLDIIAVNFGTSNIGVLLGRGDGSFEEQMTFSTGTRSNPYLITICNFNDDDQMDLAVTSSGTNRVLMLFGDGMGKFALQIPFGYRLRGVPIFIAGEDFNYDGQSEVVVAYDNADNIDILTVYDTGNFTSQITYPTGRRPMSVAVGDFNNDTRLDIVIANTDDNTISVLLGYDDGSFSNTTTYRTGNGPSLLIVADFNNDTRLDIIVVNFGDGNIGAFFGYGDGSFSNHTMCLPVRTNIELLSPDYPWYTDDNMVSSSAIGDFNNDTYLDLVLIYRTGKNISLAFGYGNGSFSNEVIQSTNLLPTHIAIGDFNNDAQLDIVVVGGYREVAILLGYGNGTFKTHSTYTTNADPVFVAVGDFNNDNQLDFVISLIYGYVNYVDVYLGDGNGTLAYNNSYPVGCGPIFVIVRDLNQDANVDLVIANYASNNISVLFGYGDGTFTRPMMYEVGTEPFSIAVGDLNNDTQMDIIVTNKRDNTMSLLLGDFETVLKRHSTLMTDHGSFPQSFVITDFNNDNHSDIVVANSGTKTIGVFLGFGNGSFTSETTYPIGYSPGIIACGDINNDTRMDLVVSNYENHTVDVFLGDGNSSFTNQTRYSTGEDSEPYFIAIADFDNDNRLDIIVATRVSRKVVVFHGYVNGYFSHKEEFTLGNEAYPIFLAAGDFNNDKKVDFALVNQQNDDLEIWLQKC